MNKIKPTIKCEKCGGIDFCLEHDAFYHEALICVDCGKVNKKYVDGGEKREKFYLKIVDFYKGE